jgi:hypothetical protein
MIVISSPLCGYEAKLVYGLDALSRPIPNTTLDIPNGVVEFDMEPLLDVQSGPSSSARSIRAERRRLYNTVLDEKQAERATLRAKLMKTVRMLFPLYVLFYIIFLNICISI